MVDMRFRQRPDGSRAPRHCRRLRASWLAWCLVAALPAQVAAAQAPPSPQPDADPAAQLAGLPAVDAPADAVATPGAGAPQDLPPVRDRAYVADPTLRARGFVVEGVGTHPGRGITPAAM